MLEGVLPGQCTQYPRGLPSNAGKERFSARLRRSAASMEAEAPVRRN
jgi:hypothetical protein